MTLTAWFLIVMGVTLLAVVVSLMIPVPDPDAHPFVTDPAETEHEHEGRHRMMEDGPTTHLGDSLIRPPL